MIKFYLDTNRKLKKYFYEEGSRMDRVRYVIASLVLVGLGYYSRKISRDEIFNKYVFATIVILFVCMLFRIIVPEGFTIFPAIVCVLAICLELLKYFDLFYKAKLHKIPHLKAVIGDRFDTKLVMAYIVGAGIAMVLSRKSEF